jgi:hypothetical protein
MVFYLLFLLAYAFTVPITFLTRVLSEVCCSCSCCSTFLLNHYPRALHTARSPHHSLYILNSLCKLHAASIPPPPPHYLPATNSRRCRPACLPASITTRCWPHTSNPIRAAGPVKGLRPSPSSWLNTGRSPTAAITGAQGLKLRGGGSKVSWPVRGSLVGAPVYMAGKCKQASCCPRPRQREKWSLTRIKYFTRTTSFGC